MTNRRALGFVFDRDNVQSLSALIGAVEADARFDDLEIRLIKRRLGLGKQIEALASTCQHVVVGLSFTTPQAGRSARDVERIRNYLRGRQVDNVTLVAGGPHPSGVPDQVLATGVDVVVVGEGESSFPRLLHALYTGAALGAVPGIVHRDEKGVCHTNQAARPAELDDCPPFAERFSLFSSIEITRGCPWACNYCQATHLFGGRMRHRSIDSIVAWTGVSARHDKRHMRFITPDAFMYGADGREPRLDRLAEMLERVNGIVGRENTYLGSFPSEVRPESVSREAVDLVRRFAVNDTLVIGAQSGSQRMLDLAHRGNTVEDVYRAVEIAAAAGLTPSVDFIFGMPGENDEDQRLTRRVIQDLAGMGARIHSHVFMPLAGTSWADVPPGRIDWRTRRLLDRLTGRGLHYGQWRRQQEAADEIARFREQGTRSG